MKFVYGLVALFFVVIIAVIIVSNSNQETPLPGFANCLDTAGFKMYGAYWCPHCIDQKEILGSEASKILYTECSLPKNAGQTQECQAAGITSYPTWQLPSGKRIQGVLSIQELASLSGCSMNSTS